MDAAGIIIALTKLYEERRSRNVLLVIIAQVLRHEASKNTIYYKEFITL